MVALSVVCLMAISCSSPTGSDSRAPNPQHSFSRSEPGVYVGGTYVEPSVRPCYWRDGEIVEVACHSRNESGIIVPVLTTMEPFTLLVAKMMS